ncbi:hypothetical protein FQN54_003717 [Arachnomyces sp. PD_36]|nr:hypothetical protein FQN54_003717 [Arachnomyces sp. PD_36]
MNLTTLLRGNAPSGTCYQLRKHNTAGGGPASCSQTLVDRPRIEDPICPASPVEGVKSNGVDRKFPRCLICEQASLACNYPSGPLKPGPKIGSQQQRQRKRSRDGDAEGDSGHGPSPPGIDYTTRENIDSRISGRNSVNQGLLPTDGDTQDRAAPTDRISDLSFILHPSHETSSPTNDRTSETRPSPGERQRYIAIDTACSTLGLGRGTLEKLIKTYFDNMVAINLFHEPSFSEKLSKISSTTQLSALLAAMLAFAIRFYSGESGELRCESQQDTNRWAAHFLDISLRFIEEALRECGDSTPPLCILQAAIIAAHCQLSQGVLGRAWRSLGTCVRLAYEMNLYLVDIEGPKNVIEEDTEQWCQDEEKRRTWWAVWEMDVFATTIRRTPPGVDWSQIETLLPVEDEYWFERKPRPSCFLETDPVYRWKALQDSGNQSPKAWFIVINSLMKDAQRISSPRGVPILSPPNNSQPTPTRTRNSRQTERANEARQRLETISNAVQCFRMALPSHLKYNDQYLGFDARVSGQYSSRRQEHCSIYNIYLMTQLARLMIYRYDVFKGQYRVALSTHESSDPPVSSRTQLQVDKDGPENLAIKQYFEAADAMLTIVSRSCDDHVRYINPFLSNTIWLGSAVHLVRSQFCRPGMNKSVIKSRFEVMNLSYKKCVDFWDMHTAVQKNLESLEEQLEACQRGDKHGQNSSIDGPSAGRVSPTSNITNNQKQDDRPGLSIPHERLSQSVGACSGK